MKKLLAAAATIVALSGLAATTAQAKPVGKGSQTSKITRTVLDLATGKTFTSKVTTRHVNSK